MTSSDALIITDADMNALILTWPIWIRKGNNSYGDNMWLQLSNS